MKHRITRVAAVAAIIIALLLAFEVLDESTAPAYALEQSLEAHHTVRMLQMRVYEGKDNIDKNRFMDVWIQYDEAGRLANVRIEMPNTKDEGHSIRVWKQGIERMWLPNKNSLLIRPNDEMAGHLEELAVEYNPEGIMQCLHNELEKGTLELKISEPVKAGDDILIEVTRTRDNIRSEYQINPQTKLLKQCKHFRLIEGAYEPVEIIEFIAYNQPIKASLFELSDIPDDVLSFNNACTNIGLAQGDSTDAEIAVEVVRECLEATIAQDYAKAQRLMGGMPGNALEQYHGGRILRIVSIGKPTPHVRFPQGFCVPCKIEVAGKDGNYIADCTPPVQRARNQPDRWIIDDGSMTWD
ncbi:hypothetical protein ACFL6U_15765 [Planctomycetota bacterium]